VVGGRGNILVVRWVGGGGSGMVLGGSRWATRCASAHGGYLAGFRFRQPDGQPKQRTPPSAPADAGVVYSRAWSPVGQSFLVGPWVGSVV
jgi:hypothetical protein